MSEAGARTFAALLRARAERGDFEVKVTHDDGVTVLKLTPSEAHQFASKIEGKLRE
jgi:hypothetical protein